MSQHIEIENLSTKNIKISKPIQKTKPVNYIYLPISCPEIRMPAKMKINKFSADNVSLAIDISKDQEKILKDIEMFIYAETTKHEPEIKKLSPRFKFIPENLKIVKDGFEGNKIYAKMYLKDDKLSTEFYEKKNDKKKKIPNPLSLTTFFGAVIIQFSKVFIGKSESIICVAKAVLVEEIEEIAYFEELELENEDDYE